MNNQNAFPRSQTIRFQKQGGFNVSRKSHPFSTVSGKTVIRCGWNIVFHKNSLANSLLRCAPIFEGPMVYRLIYHHLKSYIPFTKGSSGPTNNHIYFFLNYKCFMASKSVGLMLTFVAIEAVPALPGATKVSQSGL
jgi:hypothetical protein